jgi:hypothetical protein
MSAKYILTKGDLYTLLGFKMIKVNRALAWLYTPNSNLNGKTPKDVAECENIPFEVCESAFTSEFGYIELEIPHGMFTPSQLRAIFERYPDAVEKEM